MRAGCGWQVDWGTICRETNASAACYGYLAGQLTNNIQATAQDKAAQLRQAVRDGWKQYRTKAKTEQIPSTPSSAKETQPVIKEVALYTWRCPHTKCQGKGEAGNPDQERVRCPKCTTYFRTSGRAREKGMRRVFLHKCPFCEGEVESQVSDGTIHVAHKTKHGKKCSKQFRVRNGVAPTFAQEAS